VHESLVVQAPSTDEPGAKRSTHEPWFEKELRSSVRVVEPTVMASGVEAGE